MKKTALLILFISFSSSLFSQKYVDSLYNFKVVDSEIIWQKVFKSKIKDLKTSFKKSVITNIKLENLQEIEDIISFNVLNDMIDFKKYGGKTMTTTFHVQEPKEYLVVINFKPNKYRVTIKQITVNFVKTKLGPSSFEELFIRKNQIKNNKRNKKDLLYYEKHFTEKFKLKETKDDW